MIAIYCNNPSQLNVWEYHWFIIMNYLVWNEYLHTYVRNPLMLRAIYQQKMLLHIRSCLILRILCFTPISSSLKHIWDKLLSPACNNYHCILISNQWWEILHDLLYLNLIQICSHALYRKKSPSNFFVLSSTEIRIENIDVYIQMIGWK